MFGHTLSLGYGAVGESDAAALGEVLRVNGALTSLDLSDSSIGAAGVAALGEALRMNNTLTSLDLSNFGLGDDGVDALVEWLHDSTGALTQLNLCCNGFGAMGAVALMVSCCVRSGRLEICALTQIA